VKKALSGGNSYRRKVTSRAKNKPQVRSERGEGRMPLSMVYKRGRSTQKDPTKGAASRKKKEKAPKTDTHKQVESLELWARSTLLIKKCEVSEGEKVGRQNRKRGRSGKSRE